MLNYLLLFIITVNFSVSAQSEWNFGIGLDAYNNSYFNLPNVQPNAADGTLVNVTRVNTENFFPSGHLFVESPELLLKNISFEFSLGYFYRSVTSLATSYDERFNFGESNTFSLLSRSLTVRSGLRVNYKIGKYIKIFGSYEPHFHTGLKPSDENFWDNLNSRVYRSEDEFEAYQEYESWAKTAQNRKINSVQHNLAYGIELRYWRISLSYTRMYAQNALLRDFEFEGTAHSNVSRLNSQWIGLRFYWK
ncbi:MAG: hypothetical protein LAT68_05355 [Cyclobacteriaceae bacterium]|nr:hypothetical protein [Cyclobacteriaceae bacterium]MCH8515737.1 hypothetical protein [Cyclobacteriaceae bacterium]